MLESNRSSGAGNLGQEELIPLQHGNTQTAQTEVVSFLLFPVSGELVHHHTT